MGNIHLQPWSEINKPAKDLSPGNSAGDLCWDGEFTWPFLHRLGIRLGHELNHLELVLWKKSFPLKLHVISSRFWGVKHDDMIQDFIFVKGYLDDQDFKKRGGKEPDPKTKFTTPWLKPFRMSFSGSRSCRIDCIWSTWQLFFLETHMVSIDESEKMIGGFEVFSLSKTKHLRPEISQWLEPMILSFWFKKPSFRAFWFVSAYQKKNIQAKIIGRLVLLGNFFPIAASFLGETRNSWTQMRQTKITGQLRLG